MRKRGSLGEVDLSICIVSYRSRQLLRECLCSIDSNPPAGEYEVIVVENDSQDGTLEMLAEEFPRVRVFPLSEHGGYTAPMNYALHRAKGRYLIQLNPDTLILPQALSRLIFFMDAHPAVGICTPKVLNRDGSLQQQCRRSSARPWDVITYFSGLAKRFPKDPRFGRYLMSYKDENETHLVEAVSGSCMMIRQEVIEQIGYLDEQFYAYQEDTDFCVRAGLAGWQLYYYPEAQIIHYGGEGGTKVHLYRSIYIWHRSYYLYYRKHMAKDYFFLFNYFFYLLMGVKLSLALFRAFLTKKKYVGSPKP
ncbi:MAG: glycosyltransferase family 2 protein [Chloroflexi bacterium]|nr:MAG: glycosyltransferase family 2 protein [Chloroflexota bacterium]